MSKIPRAGRRPAGSGSRSPSSESWRAPPDRVLANMKTTLPPGCLYRRDQLWLDDVPLSDIAKDVGTPTYVYSRARVLENFQRFEDGFSSFTHQVLFAVKANSNAALIALL